MKIYTSNRSIKEEQVILCGICMLEKEKRTDFCKICLHHGFVLKPKFYQYAPGIWKRIHYKVSQKKLLIEKVDKPKELKADWFFGN